MIQAIGLTSLPRRHQLKPTVDDLTFEARPGRVTVLLGPEGSGKSSAVRLMLELQPGRGVTLFRGRPVHRVAHLAREVGVLLGDVPGHPARTARSHLRMLAAAAGVPGDRADDVLDVVGLSGLADQRMSALSRGMDRRLGVACALLGDPHTLIMDEPTSGLSPRETNWLCSLLRGYAKQGGTVLVTSRLSEEAADLADRVVSIDSGRLVADQEAADFARTRLRPRVAVRTPHAERFAAVLSQEARRAGPSGRDGGPLKVVHEGGTRVSVYGSSCSEVGEFAYRHGILVHQLTHESGAEGDASAPAPLDRADGRPSQRPPSAQESAGEGAAAAPVTADPAPASDDPSTGAADSALPPEPGATGLTDATGTAATGEPEYGAGTAPAAEQSEQTVPPGEETAQAAPMTADQEPVYALVAGSSPDSTLPIANESTSASAPAIASTGTPTAPTAPSASAGSTSPAAPSPAALSSSAPSPTALTSPEETTVRISDTPLAGSGGTPAATTAELPTADSLRAAWTPIRPPARPAAELPPRLHALAHPGPAAPLRYELCRLFSVRTTWIILAAAVATALCTALVLARTGIGLPSSGSSVAPAVRLLTGWPSGGVFLLPPAAVAVGLLGALAFGEEFRHPALAPARSSVPRRLGLLSAKLAVSAALAVALSLVVAVLNSAGVSLFFGGDVLALPADTAAPDSWPSSASSPPRGDAPWQLHVAAVLALTVGCAWAGLLAAGIFRSAAAGTAVVLAVPTLVAPAVRTLLGGPAGRSLEGLPGRLESALLVPWPPGAEDWVSAGFRIASQPVGPALVLSLAALLFAYLLTAVRSRAR